MEEETNEVLAKQLINKVLLKNTRNQLLAETDKYLLSDFPITPENLIKIKKYRQELRDYMNKPEIEKEHIPFPEFPL